jgi:hypothetical protein
MPALTISAVNATTDQLTITAHGLTTGAGPAAIYTQAGTLPGGLVGATDYFAIVVDANTLKLSTSNALALAGTAIDITSTGSGTLQLLVGIPYRRNTTYVAGAQIKSADLDALQDALVANWNLLTGQPQTVWSRSSTRNRIPSPIGILTGWAFAGGGTTIVPCYNNTASGVLTTDLDVPQGYRLSLLKFSLASQSASPGGSLVVTISAGSTKTNAVTTVATYTVADGSFPLTGTDQVLNFPTSPVVDDNTVMYASFNQSQTGGIAVNVGALRTTIVSA